MRIRLIAGLTAASLALASTPAFAQEEGSSTPQANGSSTTAQTNNASDGQQANGSSVGTSRTARPPRTRRSSRPLTS